MLYFFIAHDIATFFLIHKILLNRSYIPFFNGVCLSRILVNAAWKSSHFSISDQQFWFCQGPLTITYNFCWNAFLYKGENASSARIPIISKWKSISGKEKPSFISDTISMFLLFFILSNNISNLLLL